MGFFGDWRTLEAPCNCGRTQYDAGCHWEAALAGAAPTGGINTLQFIIAVCLVSAMLKERRLARLKITTLEKRAWE